MRETLYGFCMRTGNQALLDQWAADQNPSVSPMEVSHGSKQKVWWRCAKGHTWKTAVYVRTGGGTGCPVCAGKVLRVGENDLATCYPDIARQWHPTQNGDLTPQMVLPGSHKAVFWVCGRGHVWRAQVKSRVAGCGCPVCANREIRAGENSLADQFPAVAAQWHPDKNGSLSPERIASGSHRKIWWQCEQGHVWQASVVSRTSGGTGCPICAGRKVLPGENDLASRFPEIAAQWHPDKNGTLTPDQVTFASNRKVWWRCALGHAYQAAIGARTVRQSGCPYCAGRKVLAGFNDLAHLEPELAAEWHPTLNGTLTPEMVTSGSRKKVWWVCGQGHVWKAVIYSRTGDKKCGCPVCVGRGGKSRISRYPTKGCTDTDRERAMRAMRF